jgi:hypothetical protein
MSTGSELRRIRPGTFVLTSSPTPERIDCKLSMTPFLAQRWHNDGPGNPAVSIRVRVEMPGYRARLIDDTTIEDLSRLREALLMFWKKKREAPFSFNACDFGFSFVLFPQLKKKEVFLIGASNHESYGRALLEKDVSSAQHHFEFGQFATLLFSFPVAVIELPTAARQLDEIIARVKRIKWAPKPLEK